MSGFSALDRALLAALRMEFPKNGFRLYGDLASTQLRLVVTDTVYPIGEVEIDASSDLSDVLVEVRMLIDTYEIERDFERSRFAMSAPYIDPHVVVGLKLDMVCAVFGLDRNPGETDDDLRARALAYLKRLP